MPTYNYLQDVLPGEQIALPVHAIPAGDNLCQRAEAIAAAATSAQLLRLTPQEREGLSGPSSPQELELNHEFAALTKAVPELLAALGLPATAMQDAVAMEGALHQVKGAAEALTEITTAGVVLLAADLSADLDAVQETVTSPPEGQDEATWIEARALSYVVDYTQTETEQEQADRKARKILRQQRQQRQQGPAQIATTAAPPAGKTKEKTPKTPREAKPRRPGGTKKGPAR